MKAMHRASAVLVLIAAAVAAPLVAQEVPPQAGIRGIFELPVDLDLPAAPVVLDLDNASVDVALDAAAAAVLRARGPSGKNATGLSLAVDWDAGTMVVRRAAFDIPA